MTDEDIDFSDIPEQTDEMFAKATCGGVPPETPKKVTIYFCHNHRPAPAEVNGQKIQYTAYKLPNGTINVGRIHGVKQETNKS